VNTGSFSETFKPTAISGIYPIPYYKVTPSSKNQLMLLSSPKNKAVLYTQFKFFFIHPFQSINRYHPVPQLQQQLGLE